MDMTKEELEIFEMEIKAAAGARAFFIQGKAGNDGKICVSKHFTARGSVMPCLSGRSREDSLNDFDQPELLTIFESHIGPVICLKRDERYIRRRTEIAREVMKEQGINSPEDTQALLPTKLLQLRDEIDRRLAAEN